MKIIFSKRVVSIFKELILIDYLLFYEVKFMYTGTAYILFLRGKLNITRYTYTAQEY